FKFVVYTLEVFGMSHLHFPRLHFRGQFSVNPGTANNDDFGNPSFVDSAHVRVDTLERRKRVSPSGSGKSTPRSATAAGWNPYGDSGCRFGGVTCHSSEPVAGTLATTTAADPVIGAKVSLQRGVMVDQDPEGTTSTQIFAAQFNLSGPAGLSVIGRPSVAV